MKNFEIKNKRIFINANYINNEYSVEVGCTKDYNSKNIINLNGIIKYNDIEIGYFDFDGIKYNFNEIKLEDINVVQELVSDIETELKNVD